MATPHSHGVATKGENKKCEERDIFELGLAVRPKNPYFLWRSSGQRFKDLYIPRKVIRAHNIKIPEKLFLVDEQGRNWRGKIQVAKNKSFEELWCREGWRYLCKANHIVIGDTCICEFVQERCGHLSILVHVVKAHTFSKTDGTEEEFEQADEESTQTDDYESGIQMNFSKFKHKLKSSSSQALVTQSTRKDKTFGGQKGVDDDGDDRIEKIDMETYFRLSKRSTWKTEDVQKRKIENQDAYTKTLKGIIKNLIEKDVSWKRRKRGHRVKFPCYQDEDKSSNDGIEFIRTPNSLQATRVGLSAMRKICLPETLELLQSYFELVHEQDCVSISLDGDVFGKKYKIYFVLKDINNFCLLEPISDCCIVAYVWYLYRKMKRENILDRFLFVNPAFISYLSTIDQRVCALVDRLIGASTNQLVLVPCNVGFHWVLTLIEPYNQTVFLLDPLSHRIHNEAWQDVVNTALLKFSAAKGEKGNKSPVWVVIKAPLQPDLKQCGFYIMRYMREILEAFRDHDLTVLQSVLTKDIYSQDEIDEVRIEFAECILGHLIVKEQGQ